ncbi:hypothetical protein WG904_05075 [Pedobacter sp. Du54]|uniref:hypothetical protein n=1 Tax=Pedobacter anseongensis TaxID=3133439 RepID=UPI0030957A40
MKRNFLLFSILLCCVCACKTKISNLTAYNRYLQNFNTHILNDSLQLHITTPADITYVIAEPLIKHDLKLKGIKTTNPILVYGKTTDPSYQFLVTIGSKKEKPQKNKIIADTLINQFNLHFLGIHANNPEGASLKADLKKIYGSLKSGSDYMKDTGSVMSIVNKSMSSNTFLKALTEIRQFPMPKNQGNSLELQMQLTFSSFLGNNPFYEKLIHQIEGSFKPNDSIVSIIKKNLVVEDAMLDTIIAKAKLTNVVMINENHFYPNHRSFILAILPKLRSVGYTHLALEALSAPYDSLLNEPGAYPTLKTGFYTREQTYGNLLREAKALGFRFVAYENENTSKDRELGQAENLYGKTIGVNEQAKVVVIAGIDHILEDPTSTGRKWMAARFKELYHINPLTISQTHFNLYRKNSIANYQLLSKSELNGIKNSASVDYFLLNNNLEQPSLWKEKFNYQNRFGNEVQISLFYKEEMKNDKDYWQNIPYFTALVPAGESIKIPYNKEKPALLITYDKLGNVLQKQLVP